MSAENRKSSSSLTDPQLHSNLENNLLNPWRDNDALKMHQTFKTNN